jgi:hypothetical protein
LHFSEVSTNFMNFGSFYEFLGMFK